jgi:transmembrane sensor
MTTEEFHLLYEKLLSGAITAEEQSRLISYIDEIDAQDPQWQDEMGNRDQIEDEIYVRLIEKTRPKRGLNKGVLAIAAALTGGIVMITALYKSPRPPVPMRPTATATTIPGSSKATLTLADGSVIALDSAVNGSTITKEGVKVKQVDNGVIAYKAENAAAASWSTISTPVGGQYQIVLEDGTKAWLNAASSLRFPSSFRNNERTVEVSGEVYFEIAQDAAKPFKVKFNGNRIDVLGTHFNVMAYKDEAKSKITLLEGAIAVSNNEGRQLLKPGMQAQVSDSISHIQVSKANVEEAVAWKNGYFTFNQESIESIMRKLARWYGVNVRYQGDMSAKIFTGTVSRTDDISEVLGMMQLTGAIHFQLQGKELIVYP